MQWYEKKGPFIGDKRVIRRFLFIPKCIDGIYKWLTIAKIEQRYVHLLGWEAWGGYSKGCWVDHRWMD